MKGMAYTPFAVMASGLLISLMMMPYSGMDLSIGGEADQIGQASFYHEKVHDDSVRAYDIAFDRSLSAATARVVSDGVPLSRPREAIASGAINATVEGQTMNYTVNSSMRSWANRVSNTSETTGYQMNWSFPSVEVDMRSPFTLSSNLTFRSRLYDPSLRLYLNETAKITTSQQIEGLEDPYLRIQTRDFYGHIYSRCSFNSLINDIGAAGEDSGSLVWGRAVIEPDMDDNPTTENRVLVGNDVEADYTPDQVQQFEAFISEDSVGDPADYNSHYQTEQTQLGSINQNMSLIMDSDQLYNTHFRDMIRQSCYLPSTGGNLNGPGFLQRLQNDGTADNQPGLVSLVDKEELQTSSTDSNTDYVFFSDNPGQFGTPVSIRGVTFGESGSDYRSSFRIDQYHVNQWNIQELSE